MPFWEWTGCLQLPLRTPWLRPHPSALTWCQIVHDHIDYVPPNAPIFSNRAQLLIFGDKEVVIKFIIKDPSPNMRHVSRTHRAYLYWLFWKCLWIPAFVSNVWTLTESCRCSNVRFILSRMMGATREVDRSHVARQFLLLAQVFHPNKFAHFRAWSRTCRSAQAKMPLSDSHQSRGHIEAERRNANWMSPRARDPKHPQGDA